MHQSLCSSYRSNASKQLRVKKESTEHILENANVGSAVRTIGVSPLQMRSLESDDILIDDDCFWEASPTNRLAADDSTDGNTDTEPVKMGSWGEDDEVDLAKDSWFGELNGLCNYIASQIIPTKISIPQQSIIPHSSYVSSKIHKFKKEKTKNKESKTQPPESERCNSYEVVSKFEKFDHDLIVQGLPQLASLHSTRRGNFGKGTQKTRNKILCIPPATQHQSVSKNKHDDCTTNYTSNMCVKYGGRRDHCACHKCCSSRESVKGYCAHMHQWGIRDQLSSKIWIWTVDPDRFQQQNSNRSLLQNSNCSLQVHTSSYGSDLPLTLITDQSNKTQCSLWKNIIPPSESSRMFDLCRNFIPWRRGGNKWSAWMTTSGCTCPYRYGTQSWRPSSMTPWMNEFLTNVLQQINWTGVRPNSVNCNLYESIGDGISWHQDDETLFTNSTSEHVNIFSISLGRAGIFDIGMNSRTGIHTQCRLRTVEGDVLLMHRRFQRLFWHRIWFEEGMQKVSRINLTFRFIRCHDPSCAQSTLQPNQWVRDLTSENIESNPGPMPWKLDPNVRWASVPTWDDPSIIRMRPGFYLDQPLVRIRTPLGPMTGVQDRRAPRTIPLRSMTTVCSVVNGSHDYFHLPDFGIIPTFRVDDMLWLTDIAIRTPRIDAMDDDFSGHSEVEEWNRDLTMDGIEPNPGPAKKSGALWHDACVDSICFDAWVNVFSFLSPPSWSKCRLTCCTMYDLSVVWYKNWISIPQWTTNYINTSIDTLHYNMPYLYRYREYVDGRTPKFMTMFFDSRI